MLGCPIFQKRGPTHLPPRAAQSEIDSHTGQRSATTIPSRNRPLCESVFDISCRVSHPLGWRRRRYHPPVRTIEPTLTPRLRKHVGDDDVAHAAPYAVKTYRELVEHIAQLAYSNPNHLLYFRGQDKDFLSKAGASTLYPAIYRGDSIAHREIVHRFEQLEVAETNLTAHFVTKTLDGHRDVERKRHVRWSILQHYNVVSTPLLDITQSLRVACSFAQRESTDQTCYVYVLGLPYATNRISINSEEEIVSIRLLSICPPSALRPYFQEGYMVGTSDVTYDFGSKSELDFRNRLIAKFAIPRARSSFWRGGFSPIPERALYPPRDPVKKLCLDVKQRVERAQRPLGTLGDFIVAWSRLESWLLENARRITERNVSVGEAINAVARDRRLSKTVVSELQALRQFRNTAVHKPDELSNTQIVHAHRRLLAVLRQINIGAA